MYSQFSPTARTQTYHSDASAPLNEAKLDPSFKRKISTPCSYKIQNKVSMAGTTLQQITVQRAARPVHTQCDQE